MASSSLPRLDRESSILLLVDVQEKLVPALHEGEGLVKSCATLAQAAALLEVPILVTEQNPSRLGRTVEAVKKACGPAPVFEKMLFSAVTPEVQAQLANWSRKTVLLCGAETHVCVMQTALDLLDLGYEVFIVRDAVSSRKVSNVELGLARMERSGAIPTSVESAIFELLKVAGTAEFKALLPLIK